MHQAGALSHADEAWTLAHHDCLGIKTYPIIMNCELDLSQCPVESHLEMLHTAVLDRIVQRFL